MDQPTDVQRKRSKQVWATGPAPEDSVSLRVRGGPTAPGRARAAVASQLGDQLTDMQASDIALIVTELVTNSVVHAGVRLDEVLTVELGKRPGRLRIIVTDAGSDLEPRLRSPDETGHHFGLLLVRELCSTWGVDHDKTGMTRVWCELALDPCPAEWPTVRVPSSVH